MVSSIYGLYIFIVSVLNGFLVSVLYVFFCAIRKKIMVIIIQPFFRVKNCRQWIHIPERDQITRLITIVSNVRAMH